MVHMYGPARDTLNHGIRLGVSAAELRERGVDAGDARDEALFDFFGTLETPIPRQPERISVVFAFADPG